MPTRRLALLAGFAGLCLLALVTAGVGRSVLRTAPERPVAATDPVLAAHCSQHIELARANFGAEWKRRLDPRDTLCAEQVQQAWERDWKPRETPFAPALQPKTVASAAQAAKVVPPQEEPAQRSKTYALAAVTDANAGATKPAGQDVSPVKPAGQDARSAQPARRHASTAENPRQDTSTNDVAGQDTSAADVTDQEDAADSSDAGEYDYPSHAAFEDGDQSEMVADEHGQDEHAFSPSDDADDETGALNSEHLERRSRYDDDIQRPPYDDSEVDEYDDIGDVDDR